MTTIPARSLTVRRARAIYRRARKTNMPNATGNSFRTWARLSLFNVTNGKLERIGPMAETIENVKDALLFLVKEAERLGGAVNVVEFSLALTIKPGEQMAVVTNAGGRTSAILTSQMVVPLPIGRYYAGMVFIPMKTPELHSKANLTIVGDDEGHGGNDA